MELNKKYGYSLFSRGKYLSEIRSGKLRSFDSARKRIGKQAIGNRTDDIIKILDKSWTKLHSKDDIRKYLKRFIF